MVYGFHGESLTLLVFLGGIKVYGDIRNLTGVNS